MLDVVFIKFQFRLSGSFLLTATEVFLVLLVVEIIIRMR
ncbi:hypothetical protein C5167_006356 [Papaver somniferum]|uniref:Uncharacterized protein n=1 Tax=Papaver somniferum TaxID=3469 RepID=A0A4Y7JH23_PAPSO|nr:hypothetical protein C5167_006356 [Papaver somniferum]